VAVYRYAQIPNGSKRIGKGIVFSWAGNAVRLKVDLEVSGEGATAALAAEIGKTIETIWNASFTDNYQVTSTVNTRFRIQGSEDSDRTQIYVTHDNATTYVRPFPTLYYAYMNYYINSETIASWTPAHEFGHLLGLDDKYEEGIRSRIHSMYGGSRSTPVIPGWEGNIMAAYKGTLQKRNLQELFALHAYELITFVEDGFNDMAGLWTAGIRKIYTGW